MALPAWPGGAVRVFRDALPSGLLDSIAEESTAVAAAAPNFWVPRELIEQPPDQRELSTLAEAVVCSIYDRVMRPVLGDRAWAGAEWWSQVYNNPGKGLAFHFDKDEHLMARAPPTAHQSFYAAAQRGARWVLGPPGLLGTGGIEWQKLPMCAELETDEEEGRMVNPAYSSIVYLNSASECGGGGGGTRLSATLIMNQTFDPVTREGVPEPFRGSAVVWPSENAFCVFDGRLAHGVLDSSSQLIRRTLLINWWEHRPLKVSRRAAEDYAAEFNLSPAPDPVTYSDAEKLTPAAREAVLDVITVTAATHCSEGPTSLEDALALLEEEGVPPRDAAAMIHTDCVLWQVEDEEGRPKMAFIPDALIPGSSASDSGDSESTDEEEGGFGAV